MASSMDGKDYPIAHFDLMREIAVRLKELSIQILNHEYHYESFGSWWFEYMKTGERFRVLFDGKEQVLSLEQNVGDWMKRNWKELASKRMTTRDPEEIIQEVLWLMNAIMATNQ